MKKKTFGDVLFKTAIDFGYILLALFAFTVIVTLWATLGKAIFGTSILTVITVLLGLLLSLIFIVNLMED